MRAIVLAAGMGTRLRPATEFIPKAMMPLADGQPLLAYTVESLLSSKIAGEVTVVGGYQYNVIADFVAERYSADTVTTVYNDVFDVKGPIWSIAAALAVNDCKQVAVLNGDTYFSDTVLNSMFQTLNAEPKGCYLFGSVPEAYQPDDIKVHARKDGTLFAAGKKLSVHNAVMKSAGFFASTCAEGTGGLTELIDAITSGRLQEPATWHECLSALSDSTPIGLHLICPDGWCEVDEESDLEHLTLVSSLRSSLAAGNSR